MQKFSGCKNKLQNAIDNCGGLCYNLYAERLAVYICMMLTECLKRRCIEVADVYDRLDFMVCDRTVWTENMSGKGR